MKTVYGKILVLAVAAILLTLAIPANVQGKGGKTGWTENERGGPGRRPELAEERTDRMMERLKESDPNKAAEIEKLCVKDPNEFRAALRETMRERFRERALLPDANRQPGPKGEMIRERLRDRADDYLEWLKANYPAEAERLAELKKNKPNLYKRQLLLSGRKYERIAEASKENPELAKVLKDDLELRNRSFDILRKIKAETNEAERQKLTGELEKVTSDKFDVILKRKQLEYDRLRKELDRLAEHVKQSEVQLEKWRENKPDKVKERVNDLLSKTEKFEWD